MKGLIFAAARKASLAAVHGGAAGMRGLAVKGNTRDVRRPKVPKHAAEGEIEVEYTGPCSMSNSK